MATLAIFGYVLYLLSDKNMYSDVSIKEMILAARNAYVRFCLTNKITQLIELGILSLFNKIPSKKSLSQLGRNHLILCVFGLAGLVIVHGFAGFVLGILVACTIFYLRGIKTKRNEERNLIKQLPDTFRTMGMMLASGKTLMQACSYIAEHSTGVISQAFGSCAMGMQLGESRESALKTLASVLDIECVKLVICAIEVSQITGAPLQDLLYKAAFLLEDQQKLQEYIQVKTAQAQASIKVVVFLPIVIVGTLAFISPEFREGMAGKVGMLSILLASLLDAIAIVLIKRLMRGVEQDVIY